MAEAPQLHLSEGQSLADLLLRPREGPQSIEVAVLDIALHLAGARLMIAWMQPATRGTSFKISWPSTTRSLTAALIFQNFATRHEVDSSTWQSWSSTRSSQLTRWFSSGSATRMQRYTSLK